VGPGATGAGLRDRAPQCVVADVTRARIIEGLERFREIFGAYPSVHVNHHICGENVYWGPDRVSGINRTIYSALNRRGGGLSFEGHVESSPLF
jgi:hypothetical protein